MPSIRRTRASQTPETISSRAFHSPTRLRISVSAMTTQSESIVSERSAVTASSPKSFSVRPRAWAIFSTKLPVPAAQRSFMTNRSTRLSFTFITLLSCPPISMIVRVPGSKNLAPRAKAVISVITLLVSIYSFIRRTELKERATDFVNYLVTSLVVLIILADVYFLSLILF